VFNTVLLIIASGVFGFEVFNSITDNFELDKLKTGLTKTIRYSHGKVNLFKRWGVIPTVILYTFLPVLFLVRFVLSLLSCPFCIAFWTGAISSYFLLSGGTVQSVTIGLCSMLVCSIYYFIRSSIT